MNLVIILTHHLKLNKILYGHETCWEEDTCRFIHVGPQFIGVKGHHRSPPHQIKPCTNILTDMRGSRSQQ